jgi:hypothetical protein
MAIAVCCYYAHETQKCIILCSLHYTESSSCASITEYSIIISIWVLSGSPPITRVSKSLLSHKSAQSIIYFRVFKKWSDALL